MSFYLKKGWFYKDYKLHITHCIPLKNAELVINYLY